VFLEVYVVELRNIVLEFLLLEHLFDEVLTVVPSPWLIDLSEVFHYETALLYASLIDADSTLTLGVHAEASLIFGQLVIPGKQIGVEVVSLSEQLERLRGQVFIPFFFFQLFLQWAACWYFSVHDVLTCLIEVVPLSAHKV
jgi:hypothetical protein